MKKIRRIFLIVFALLFVNLLSINVTKVDAVNVETKEEHNLDLSNAYRGNLKGYWALVNFGEDYIGSDTITIFLDPEAIENMNIKYILMSEYDSAGEVHSTYYERGIDANFASRFTYTFINKGYGKKHFNIFLLSDLYNKPFSIVERIDVDKLERLRTIASLNSGDFVISQEVTEWTDKPYKIYVDIKNRSCEYKLKNVFYSYYHTDINGKQTLMHGTAIKEEGTCNKFYFKVSENSTYYINVEDIFGVKKPNENESLFIKIDNFLDTTINIVTTYDHTLTNQDVLVTAEVYDGKGVKYPNNLIKSYIYVDPLGNQYDIKNLDKFYAKQNGVYQIICTTDVTTVTVEINITNIDRIGPNVFITSPIKIVTSSVEHSPYIFNPDSYILATDDVSSGDKLKVTKTYYYVSEADPTCKKHLGNLMSQDIYDYLYGVNDLCMQVDVEDEAGNNSIVRSKIEVSDDTKPTIKSSISEIILQIGDDMPNNDELINKFGISVDDNSRKYHPEREITVNGDFSSVNLEELGRYEVFMYCIDEAGNISDSISLIVVVTIRTLVIDAVPKQYIVYGEKMITIKYTCNGNPCEEEILPQDLDKLSGELYIAPGSKYSGEYPIASSITINSNKYAIQSGNLGVFTIKKRTFKVIANSFEIDYKDEEPILTWYMDTTVCNPDLSTKYTNFDEINYSCTFVSNDDFIDGVYIKDNTSTPKLYAGGIVREEGITVKYDVSGNVIYYRIEIGNLKVKETSNGGRDNYFIDFYGLYQGELTKGYARFYIYPKDVEVTIKDVNKIYGEADPNPVYDDTLKGQIRDDKVTNVQYEFACFSYKEPIKSMCMEGSDTYSLSNFQDEIQMFFTREQGENYGSYIIQGNYSNDNYMVYFNSKLPSKPVKEASLYIHRRDIELSVDGAHNDGKYTIFYEDALPTVTISVTTDPNILYQGLANNNYININEDSIITFKDRLDYGTHRVKYVNSEGKVMDIVIGGYGEYIEGVGIFTIDRDTTSIKNIAGDDVLSNYNLKFNKGSLEVLARQIYIKIVEGLEKIYGDKDPLFTKDYVEQKYGKDSNYIVDGSGRFILQIFNTLDNSDIVDDPHYEPFDKDKLKYFLKRDKDSKGIDSKDVHEGEMVGDYLINVDHFENDTNYIIDLFTTYNFKIKQREVYVNGNNASIEFNYNNYVPKFTYSFDNLAFDDALISQPKVKETTGYRNNGTYVINQGDINVISGNPIITSVDNYWYLNGEDTNISLDELASLDNYLIKIENGKYYIYDVNDNTYKDTGITSKEYSVDDNYIIVWTLAFLDVNPREVIIVPDDGKTKQYAEDDIELTYKVMHYGDYLNDDFHLEAILDPTDFIGNLSREKGEKPGKYPIIQNTLVPSEKGFGYGANFIVKGFDDSHYFEITKRELVIRHAASDENNRVTVFYGDSGLDSIVSGYKTIKGSPALNNNLCTEENINGEMVCDPIYDKIVGSITTNPEHPEDVGIYQIVNKDLRLQRVTSGVDVSEYYDLKFIEATLEILPRIIYVTPEENQSKIYGEEDGEGTCGIKYTFAPNLVKPTDTFSGCLKREPRMNSQGKLTSEDVGEYKIGLGDLVIGPNYQVVLNGSVKYRIKVRNITITAKVMGDNISKSSGVNAYTMMYGYDYTLGYDVGGMGVAINDHLGIHDEILNDVMLQPEYKGVGTYLVVQGKLTITNSTNYNLTFEKATFVVTKRIVHIHPHELTKIYGDKDPSAFTFDFVSDKLPYIGSLTRLPGETVGSYKIVKGTLDFGENYEIVMDEVYFDIIARKVYVDAINTSKVYSYEDPKLEYNLRVENDFSLDSVVIGMLKRDPGEDVGVYKINQGSLDINANYEIVYTPANFTIYYVDFTEINIFSLTNNKYQTQGQESIVKVYARFNKGADETNLDKVTWSVTKDGKAFKFEKDYNNIVSFTPSGGAGRYVVKASYNGISSEYEVIVRANNVSSIYITLTTNNSIQTLGLETEMVYVADIELFTEEYIGVVEWYAGNKKVCEAPLAESNNYCIFTPDLEVGKHEVYAKIGDIISNILTIYIKDNAAPEITLVDQDVVYYIEAFQNATENSVQYIEPGFSAYDDVEGNISYKVTVSGVEDINYYKVGTYYITYSVRDKHGHITNNYRTVIVQDTIAPEVKLNNPELKEIILEYGDKYVEYGATVTDAYDDYYGYELTVFIDSDLNVNKVGEYTIVYFAVDSNGLRGQATRKVIVQDTIKPTITLIGEETITLEYKSTYRDQGAWFVDNYDGKMKIYATSIVYVAPNSDSPINVNAVDTTLLGTFRLTYYKEDSSGNPPEEVVVRTVIVIDSTPPIITLSGSNPFILRYGDEYVDPGFKVIDNYDGDITNNKDLVTIREVIGDTLGTYFVYYNARDSHNNIAKEVIRTVIIVDLVSPIIYFTDKCPQYIYLEALTDKYDSRCDTPGYGFTVFDDYTPDIDAIQNWVKVTGTVDNTTINTYEIYYNVSDRSGNHAITLTRYVIVRDTIAPEITLLPNKDGDINFYVEVFGEYVEPGWQVSDLYDDYHGITINVTTTNNIDLNKLNTYQVTYIATDSSGNSSEPIYREVTVRDTVPPEVTLIGEAVITLERGVKYAEYGATAKDNYDGILSNIEITGQPTGMNLGKFIVTYCATDSSNNTGCTTREVNVVDTIPPTILGVEDGKYYRSPLYIYYSPLTGTDEILTGTLNGKLISSPWFVKEENKYTLTVTDDAGNSTTISFVIDMTPPVLYGTDGKEYINHPVTLYSDEELESITYRVGNGGFVTKNEQELTFTAEGEYWAYAIDKAGNIGKTISFVIDTTLPEFALIGVENKGITDTEVKLITEPDVIVAVNDKYIPTSYTFVENGYYKITIRDKAGNDVLLQFVINKENPVTINDKTVTFISQNNAIGQFIAKGGNYPRGSGFIYAKPKLDGTFTYISGTLFSDEEYSKLIAGEDISFDVPEVNDDEMVVSFIVTLDELNKFTTQTVEDDDNSALIYGLIFLIIALLIGGGFYFFFYHKRKTKEEEDDEETEEIIDDEDDYYGY